MEIFNIDKAEAARIRAKVNWIEKGEKSTNYFLNLEKYRANNGTVFKIIDKNGNLITDEKDIVEVFADHFSNVYSDNSMNDEDLDSNMENFLNNVNLKTLSEIDKLTIDYPITIEEIKTAFQGLNENSSPGLDGLTMDFYKIFFEEIKSTLFEFYNSCFSKRALSEQTQSGLISLIHKGKSLIDKL